MSYQISSNSKNMSTEVTASQSSMPLHPCDGYSQEPIQQVRQSVIRAVKRKDYHRAIAVLNRLIAFYPCNAVDYSNRGLVYLWVGKAHKALGDFDRAIALNPSLASFYNNRANCYISQGDQESAIADYDRAIDIDPFYVRARINRAVTLRELGRYEAALDGFDEALLFRQFTGEIYAERGRAYHLRGDWNGAIADYRRALHAFAAARLDPKSAASPRVKRTLTWLQELQPMP